MLQSIHFENMIQNRNRILTALRTARKWAPEISAESSWNVWESTSATRTQERSLWTQTILIKNSSHSKMLKLKDLQTSSRDILSMPSGGQNGATTATLITMIFWSISLRTQTMIIWLGPQVQSLLKTICLQLRTRDLRALNFIRNLEKLRMKVF